ncbi:MAG: hypothetical protein AVDCRST_MAG50-2223, partial [uncultured Acidimicrobiales bacterium]
GPLDPSRPVRAPAARAGRAVGQLPVLAGADVLPQHRRAPARGDPHGLRPHPPPVPGRAAAAGRGGPRRRHRHADRHGGGAGGGQPVRRGAPHAHPHHERAVPRRGGRRGRGGRGLDHAPGPLDGVLPGRGADRLRRPGGHRRAGLQRPPQRGPL